MLAKSIAGGVAVGAGVGTVLDRLPPRALPIATAQVAAVFGAIDVGAAIRSGDRRAVATEAIAALAYTIGGLAVATTRPAWGPAYLGAHAAWDARQHLADDARPPAAWYPAFCAAVDVAIGVAGWRAWRRRR